MLLCKWKKKGSGPDGFPVKFYQTFREIIKSDLMYLFECFQHVELPRFQLNYSNIILLPKKENAVQQYRPIHLVSVSFKIFRKVGTNRVTKVMHIVIRLTRQGYTF
jgi:hypothetical protein